MTHKKVIELLEGLCVEPEPHEDARLDADELDAVLIAIEAIKARPHGEWIDIEGYYCECSNCKIVGVNELDYANFCPNCGADMRGEKNG